MPSEAIASVKISVPELRSAGRSIGTVIGAQHPQRLRARGARGVLERGIRAGERGLAGHIGDRQQARRLDQRHPRDRVDRDSPDVQSLCRTGSSGSRPGPRRRSSRARSRAAARAAAAASGGRRAAGRQIGARRRGSRRRLLRAPTSRSSGRRTRACSAPRARRPASESSWRYGRDREDPAGFVQRAVAERRVEQREERARGSRPTTRIQTQPMQRPRRNEARRRGRGIHPRLDVQSSRGVA